MIFFRLQDYERKFPNIILKPQFREGRPKTAKNTSFEASFRASPLRDMKPVDRIDIIGTEDSNNVALRKIFSNDGITKYENKITDQLIPIEYRSNYAYYAPSGDIAELALEQRWRDNQNKRLMEKREHEELVNVMKEWSHAKSRLEEESVRKNESLAYGSRFEKRGFKLRVQSASIGAHPKITYSPIKSVKSSKTTAKMKEEGESEDENQITKDLERALDYESDDEFQEAPAQYLTLNQIDPKSIIFEDKKPKNFSPATIIDFTNIAPVGMKTGEILPSIEKRLIEVEIGRLKVEKIRKMHASVLQHTGRHTDKSLLSDASFLAEKINRPASLSIYDGVTQFTAYKPFSAIYDKINEKTIRREQITEISDVKKKLAKFRINVPIRVLANSLLPPDKIPQEKLKALPDPGGALLRNPFFKEKKSKKKKKKKKA